MRDINLVIRKAYKTALAGVGAQLFYQQAPDDIADSVYIVISSITSTDISAKGS